MPVTITTRATRSSAVVVATTQAAIASPAPTPQYRPGIRAGVALIPPPHRFEHPSACGAKQNTPLNLGRLRR